MIREGVGSVHARSKSCGSRLLADRCQNLQFDSLDKHFVAVFGLETADEIRSHNLDVIGS